MGAAISGAPTSSLTGYLAAPETEDRARRILGLGEDARAALPPRAEQLWRLDGFAAHVPLVNTMFVPVGRNADIGLVSEAMAAVAARHEALRTRLAVKDGAAVMIAGDWNIPRLEISDIEKRDLDENRPGGRATAVSAFAGRAMNLLEQDAIHAQAFRDETGEVTLGIAAHYFFSDAWSSQILKRDIAAALAALSTNVSPALAPALQYADYARAQRGALGKNLARHLAYWQSKLAENPAARLPHDHARETAKRGRAFFHVPNDVAARLSAIAQTHRVSLTLLLLGLYQLALARWSGQDFFLTAAYTADRLKPEFHQTVGSLIVNMPVAARLDHGETLPTFLDRLGKEFYGAYAHRDLSVELIEAIFSPPPSFCASVFNFVPMQKSQSAETLSVPQFDGVFHAPDAPRPALYREIYLGLVEHPGGLLGKIFYNADYFAPQGVEVFAAHFQHVAACAEPEARIATLLA